MSKAPKEWQPDANSEEDNEDTNKRNTLARLPSSFGTSALTITTNTDRRGSIGERIKKARGHKLDKSSSFARKLWIVVLAILVSSVVLHGFVFVMVDVVVDSFFPHHHYGKRFDELGEPYKDIIEETIPYVQGWYQGIDTSQPLLPLPRDISPSEKGGECLVRWFHDLENAVPFTTPSLVELVLFNLGISESPLVRMHLQDQLSEPQSLSMMVNDTTRCFRETIPLQRLCTVLEEGKTKPDFNDSKQRHVLEYMVNFYAVSEVLTSTAMTDMALLSELSQAMNAVRPSLEDHFKEVYSHDKAEFANVKLRGLTAALQKLSRTLAENGSYFSRDFLPVNILEAVKLEASLGHEANARVGLALAASVTFSGAAEDHQLKWRLGKEWVDAYIAWNLAFVVSSIPLERITKLLLPSVVCAASESVQGESFITSRTISLALNLMHVTNLDSLKEQPFPELIEHDKLKDILEFLYSEEVHADIHSQERYELAEAMGESNLKHTMVPSPFHGQVEEMLYNLCGEDCHDAAWKVTDTSPQSSLNDEDFRVYFGVIIWGTVLLAGFGCELLFLVMLSQYGWFDEQETRWWFAQFLFPLLAMTTLGLAMLRNFLALPFLVLGLWKFGMPETISYMYTSLYDLNKTRTGRLADFFNSSGTALHHSSATIAIAFMLVGVIPANRHTVGAMLILIMQHWFVLIKYVNVWVYLCIVMGLEVFFQWVILSDLEYLHEVHWTAAFAALGMLTAHWLYLIAGGIELIHRLRECKGGGEVKKGKTVDFECDQATPPQSFSVGEYDAEYCKDEETSYDEESFDEEEP